MDLDIYDYATGIDGPWGTRPPAVLESDHEQRKQAQDRLVIETLKVREIVSFGIVRGD
jgi:hypothetical protein